VNLNNLFGYSRKDLDEVIIGRESYLTKKGFSPEFFLGQAFGADTNERSYNHFLAQAILNARTYFGEDIPAIVQAEIGSCLGNLGVSGAFFHQIGEVYQSGKRSLVISKMSTKEVLTESKYVLNNLGLSYHSALFVAHPYHMERVLHIAESIGILGEPFVRKGVEWPKEDLQPWVRSPFVFVPREIIARIINR